MRKMIWVLVAIYAAIGLVLWTAPSFAAPEVVAFTDARFAPGTIVVKNRERRLYLVQRGGVALCLFLFICTCCCCFHCLCRCLRS